MLSKFNVEYFFAIPPETKIIWFWLGFFVLSLISIIVLYLYYRTKGRTITPYKAYAKTFFWPNLTITIIGILLALSRYERLALLSWRFWVYVAILLLVVFNVWFFMVRRNQLEDELVKFHNTKRKEKWLTITDNTKHKTNKTKQKTKK